MRAMTDTRPSWYLHEWRVHLGWTQDRLAAETGLHKGDVSKLERGLQRWNEMHLQAFARALGIQRWWLTDVDPTDPASDLELINAVRNVPAAKRPDARRIILALGEPADRPAYRPEPEAPPPKKRRRR